MSSSRPATTIDATSRQLDKIVQAVIERGYDQKQEDFDDYSILIHTVEYRKLVIYQVYDSYFPPKRHEYELHLLTTLVESIESNTGAAFVGGAIAGGIIGNAAYDCLKRLLAYLVGKLKPLGRSQKCFREIGINADRLMKFFNNRKQADLSTICRALNAEADKIEPLLMLLGFRCRRRGNRRLWISPNTSSKVRRKNP